MLQDIFYTCYTLLHGYWENSVWPDIYTYSGILLFLTSSFVAILFYWVLNRISAKYYKLKHWFFFLGINAFINTCWALICSYFVGEFIGLPAEVLLFAFVNFFYSIVLFFVISMIIKRGSPHAKYTPLNF